MKRKISVLMLVALLFVNVFSGCGKKEESAPADTLQKLTEANTVESLMSREERVAYRVNNYISDGSSYSQYTYCDADRLVYEDENILIIDEKGDLYGFNYVDKEIYRALFIGDAYAEELAAYNFGWLSSYVEDDSEVVIDYTVKDGVIYLQTEAVARSYNAEYFGYNYDESDKIAVEYELDADTYTIQKILSYYVKGDDRYLIIESEKVDAPEVYTVDSTITDGVFAEDTRTLTLIEVEDGNEVARYSQTVGRGNGITAHFASEYEATLYTDATCTEPVATPIDKNEDLTAYIHKIEV